MEVDAKKVLSILDKTYPNAGSELKFKNPFELLVAVML
ncbi:MAG TPA: endonuclease III, partial [Clostridiaceae bacterium]|nr:endonuclease III [Clostridiaceae bacterium]